MKYFDNNYVFMFCRVCWEDLNIPSGLSVVHEEDQNIEFCKMKKKGENDIYTDGVDPRGD